MTRSSSTIVLIQSRLASARLPAKALLPVARFPAVVLCALRAANTGLRVVVATSDTPPDDAIVEVLKDVGIEFFRGSHHDVLLRFSQATRELPETGVVVRLTADNLFPDGAFVEEVLGEFNRRGVDYLAAGSPSAALPYGMSAEVFTVAALRRAEKEAHDDFDREHVTPWIRRFCSTARYVHSGQHAHWSRLRCTLDTFADYKVLLRVFSDVRDPVKISWQDLVARLTSVSPGGSEPRTPFRERADGRLHSLLTLGTAQLGSNYGIANKSGMPCDDEVEELLMRAADAGITSIDTASAYGCSEQQIGRFLPANFIDQIRVITKLDVLAGLPDDAAETAVANAVDASVFRSLHRLRRQRIEVLLLHRWSHHDSWEGAAWKRLGQLQVDGLIGTLGASVSNPAEAIAALSDPRVGHLQCPVNILDWRWREAEFLAKVATRPDVVIHARSVLLQGMLTLPAHRWVQRSGVDAERLCAILDDLVRSFQRTDRVDLCMAHVASLPWVTSLVVGMENVSQLQANLARIRAPALSERELGAVADRLPRVPESLLNPALWGAANV